MECSRCGAPVQQTPGHALTCQFCGQAAAPPAHGGPGGLSVYVVNGQIYGSADQLPPETREVLDELASDHTVDSEASPPPAPSRGGTAVASVLIALAVLVAGVVIAFVAMRGNTSGAPHRMERMHRPSGR